MKLYATPQWTTLTIEGHTLTVPGSTEQVAMSLIKAGLAALASTRQAPATAVDENQQR